MLDGDTELLPGIKRVRVPGHTRDLQCVSISGGGQTLFFAADLAPTIAHLPYAWVMGYDLYPLTTLENKKWWLRRAARESWTVVFAHEPHTPVARLVEQPDGTVTAVSSDIQV